MEKNLPANVEGTRDVGLIIGLRRCPRGRLGNSPQYFAWRIPWTEEPGRVWSIGLKRIREIRQE